MARPHPSIRRIRPRTDLGASALVVLALIPSSMRSWFTDDRKILVVVGGLLFIAVALTLLTVRYWRITRPGRAPRDAAGRHAAGPSSKPAAATAPSTATVDAAPTHVTGFPVPPRPARPPKPVGPAPRPAVAGADHRHADADYEPRGTGEHDRVEVAAAGSARPSRDGRRAVLARTATNGAPAPEAAASPPAEPVDQAG